MNQEERPDLTKVQVINPPLRFVAVPLYACCEEKVKDGDEFRFVAGFGLVCEACDSEVSK